MQKQSKILNKKTSAAALDQLVCWAKLFFWESSRSEAAVYLDILVNWSLLLLVLLYESME